MSNVVYAWELGADLGHIANFLPIALALKQQGHAVTAVVRDLSRAATVFGDHGIPVLQAPVWLAQNAELPDPPLSFAEILQRFGYADAIGLFGLVTAWQALFDLLDPDLLVVDYAPTALLAVRGSGLPTAMFGTGFCSPPRISPVPNMRPWQAVSQGRLEASEAAVVATANGVLAACAAPPLGALMDLFEVNCDFLATYAELDHYRDRGAAEYWGPVLSPQHDGKPRWPDETGPRVFAYLKEGHPHFDAVLTRLAKRGCSVLVYAGRVSAAARARHESPQIRFSPLPLDIRAVASECEVAVCHGGHGTTAALLATGRPLLLLPMQLEQHLLGRNVTRLGAGVMVAPEATGTSLSESVDQLLDDQLLAAGAGAFARKYEDRTQQRIVESITVRCNQLLADQPIA